MKTRFFNKKLILSICTVISLIIVLYGFRNDYAFLIKPTIDVSGESFGDVIANGDDGTSAIIDASRTRLVFLDNNKKVVHILQNSVFSISNTFYKSVVFSNGKYYVSECFYDSDNSYPKSERIIIYNSNGNPENTVYEKDFDEGKNHKSETVVELNPCENGIVTLVFSYDTSEITAKRFTDKGEEVIETVSLGSAVSGVYNADYNEESKTWGFITGLGCGMKYQNGKMEYIEGVYPLNNAPNLIKIDSDGTVSVICSEYIKLPGTLHFSLMFIVKAVIFWIAFIFLTVLVLLFAFRKIKTLIALKNMSALLKICVSTATVVAIVGVSAFYSAQMMKQDIKSRQIQLNTLASLISNIPDKYISNTLSEINEVNSESLDKYLKLFDYIDAVGDSRNMEFNSTISLYKNIDKDTWCRILDNNRLLSVGYCEKYDEFFGRGEVNSETLKKGDKVSDVQDTTYGVIMASFSPIIDLNGNTVGYVEAESNFELFKISYMRTALRNFVTLLAITVGIALILVEAAAIIKSRKKRRRLIEENYEHIEIADFRTIKLFIGFLLKFDSVLMILIAKDLLINTVDANNAVILGIPAACMSFGTLAGQFLIDMLMPKIHIRKIIGFTGVFYAAMLIMTAFAVYSGNFVLYCMGVFLVNIAFGVLAGPSWVIPFMSRNEQERFEMNNTKGLADVSASVISVVLAGYAAELFGNFSIYLFALIPLAIVFICYMRSMPKKTIYGKKRDTVKNREKIKFTKYLRFIFSPTVILLLLLIIFPAVYASGYKSLIFPLFSQKQGLSKPFISNLVVIANFAAFMLNGPVEKILKNNDYWKNTVIIAIFSGIVYMSFMLNSSVAWAVIVIALLAVTDKLIAPNFNMLWPRQAEKIGVPPQRLYSMFIYTDNIASALRPAFIGLFLTIQAPYCNFWLGVCFAGCALLFAICTYNSAMNKKR